MSVNVIVGRGSGPGDSRQAPQPSRIDGSSRWRFVGEPAAQALLIYGIRDGPGIVCGTFSSGKRPMPRRQPGVLRYAQTPKVVWHEVPHVPGLDRDTQYQISLIELRTAQDWARNGLWPGAIAEALGAWRRIARFPRTRVSLPCACCGRHPRALLQEALDRLPARAVAAVRRQLTPLDDEFHRRTVPDPHLPAMRPWWDRRFIP